MRATAPKPFGASNFYLERISVAPEGKEDEKQPKSVMRCVGDTTFLYETLAIASATAATLAIIVRLFYSRAKGRHRGFSLQRSLR